MSETTDKPKLGARAPLGLKRTIETGKVKQSFSHGRSNTVVVEVKKRRILGRPGEEAAPKVEDAVAPPVSAPAPPPSAPSARAPQTPSRPVADATSRRELQERLLREAEESRLSSLEEARRREHREAKEATEDEKRRADDNRRTEEEGRVQAEEDSKRAAEEAERAASAAVATPALADEDEERRGGARPKHHIPTVKRPDPARPGRGAPRGGDDRRHSGKLTVTRALTGEDDSRTRSLAALRRAREKE
jgi:translation initiation factor IF-2